MKFLRLSDPLLSVLFEDEDIIAFDKPYGFNAHTNDSKIEHSEYIEDGLIEMLEKQFERKLFIIHRLDQTTTGVIIFGKTPEAAKKYAEYFFNRQVKKTYLFVTAARSTQTQFTIDQVIIHKGKELEAKTHLKFLKKTKAFELWQANPLTGRNHQIRIHAQAAGISILGDEKYGGAAAPFLCLHNQQIEFPNQITIKSKPPEYFEDLTLLDDPLLSKILFEVDRRRRLFTKNFHSDQSFRLAQVKQEPSFTLDQFGKYLVLNWNQLEVSAKDSKTLFQLPAILKKIMIVRLPKSQIILDPNQKKLENFENNWTASEKETRYEIRTDQGISGGLFLNQRLLRNWVKKSSYGKKVLNIF